VRTDLAALLAGDHHIEHLTLQVDHTNSDLMTMPATRNRSIACAIPAACDGFGSRRPTVAGVSRPRLRLAVG
jgi:hypothetical protein